MFYRNEVKRKIESEFLLYKEAELKKPVEEIFESAECHYFYNNIREFLTTSDNGLTEIDYKYLDGNREILDTLWETYRLWEDCNVSTYKDLKKFIKDYVRYADHSSSM